jgi:Zn-dependent M28 family amino/carboxypeptidase
MKLMINMDMIGYARDPNILRVILETDRKYSNISDLFKKMALDYCEKLETIISFNPFGSDHVPYIRRNMPAILSIDVIFIF